jgi:carboxymethylenebutenolidase
VVSGRRVAAAASSAGRRTVDPQTTHHSPLTTHQTLGFLLLALIFVSGSQGPSPKPPPGSGELPSFLDDFQGHKSSSPKRAELPLFLDVFQDHKETPIATSAVTFPSALGPVDGFFARPENGERLPALLLVHDQEPWASWMETNARQMAGIGYGVLMLDVHERRRVASRSDSPRFTDEATLAELSAGIRWLRGRGDLLPNRLGVVGWAWSGGQVQALAAATPVQACVCCGGPLPQAPGLLLGLRGTPLLYLFAGGDEVARKDLPAFRKALTAAGVHGTFHIADDIGPGLLVLPDPGTATSPAADDAWVEIYEFLGKHVESAHPNTSVSGTGGPAVKSFATVADIMRAVNKPSGLRGALSRDLEKEPASDQEWEHIRANAALVAEAGGWLQARTPARGSPRHWQEQARAFTTAAEALVTAADRHDYAAARRGLQQLATRCAACHEEHR